MVVTENLLAWWRSLHEVLREADSDTVEWTH